MKISLLLFCSTLVFAGKKGNPTPQPPRLPTPLPPRLPPIQPPIQPSAPPTNPSIFTQQCKAPRIRKEWRELTSYQQDQFFKGMNLLKNTPSTMGHSSLYNDYAYIHNDYSPYTHDTPQFFVWHRHFLLLFEKELQKVLNDPSFAFPYWEWTIDSQAPEESPLMQPNSFGTLGGRDGCVRDGAFANWRIPGGGCLQRAGTSRMDALYSPGKFN